LCKISKVNFGFVQQWVEIQEKPANRFAGFVDDFGLMAAKTRSGILARSNINPSNI